MVMPVQRRLKRKLTTIADRLRGYDFMAVELPAVNGLDKTYVNKASPSGDIFLKRVCDSLPITSEDRIIDVGCARGAAMRFFRRYPFKVIGGLEISDRLAGICEANFKKMGDKRVVTYCSDAVKFPRYGDFNYFYLYNPFPNRELLSTFVDMLCRQCAGQGTIHIIYNTPSYIEEFYDRGFELISEFDDEWGMGMKVLRIEL